MEFHRLGSLTNTEANPTTATPIWETPECPCLDTRVSFGVSDIGIAGDGLASVVVEFTGLSLRINLDPNSIML